MDARGVGQATLTPAQQPESGETMTVKLVRSLGLGNSTCATVPPSRSVMSAMAAGGEEKGGIARVRRREASRPRCYSCGSPFWMRISPGVRFFPPVLAPVPVRAPFPPIPRSFSPPPPPPLAAPPPPAASSSTTPAPVPAPAPAPAPAASAVSAVEEDDADEELVAAAAAAAAASVASFFCFNRIMS